MLQSGFAWQVGHTLHVLTHVADCASQVSDSSQVKPLLHVIPHPGNPEHVGSQVGQEQVMPEQVFPEQVTSSHVASPQVAHHPSQVEPLMHVAPQQVGSHVGQEQVLTAQVVFSQVVPEQVTSHVG
jgi:hypothetical protein